MREEGIYFMAKYSSETPLSPFKSTQKPSTPFPSKAAWQMMSNVFSRVKKKTKNKNILLKVQSAWEGMIHSISEAECDKEPNLLFSQGSESQMKDQ